MFYSHTFLGRKGPLGTVWCAAHLQHRLKKSHYASTDIPSTVERILYPEVPIALRMSGHLLLGVVRIYSKKVEYLHQDCDHLRVSLLKTFRPVDVNLPENDNQAQFNAVTLPETYALDALEINDDFLTEGSQDNHLKSLGEITLKDQYSAESDLYVRITFDDEIFLDCMHSEQREDDPMQIDNPPEVFIPPSPENQSAAPGPDIQNAGPSADIQIADLNQIEERQGMPEGESFPPHEVMRDYQGNDVNLPSPILRPHHENIDPKLNISPLKEKTEKGIDTPESLHASPQVHSEQPLQLERTLSPPNAEDHAVSDSFENVSPTDLSLRPSPTPSLEKPKPRPRKRKRKQFFDESLVLTNKSVKSSLNDCSDLVKKRKKLPCSALEQWRYREIKKWKNSEGLFSKPVISGMCDTLQHLSNKDLDSKLLAIEARQLNSSITESPAHVPNVCEDTERLPSQDHDAAHVPTIVEETELLPSPDHEAVHVSNDVLETERLRSPDHESRHNIEQMFPSSPTQFSPQTHATAETSASRFLTSVSESRFGTTDPRSDLGMLSHSTGFEMETPIIHSEERNDDIGIALSDIPELRNSELDELSFLELDNSCSSDSPGAHSENTSARTRAVAQYLKNHSPLSKFPDGPSNLSLNSILEGRPRKLCARMFYEITVLKSEGIIQVEQDEPYADIVLKLTSDNMYKI